MKNKLLMLGMPALTVILALAAASQKSTSPDANAVKIDNFTFSPATLTVSPGATVRWTNKDDVPHTVVSSDKAFTSNTLDTDQEFTYTFTKAGTYNYFCSIHPKMTATVVVK
ncbi:MAG TPA: cupredoxin family copper-binding protein [Candidatus Angelobacter sp.]